MMAIRMFSYISALEKANITQLEENQIIKYELAEHRNKMSATNIEIVKGKMTYNYRR